MARSPSTRIDRAPFELSVPVPRIKDPSPFTNDVVLTAREDWGVKRGARLTWVPGFGFVPGSLDSSGSLPVRVNGGFESKMLPEFMLQGDMLETRRLFSSERLARRQRLPQGHSREPRTHQRCSATSKSKGYGHLLAHRRVSRHSQPGSKLDDNRTWFPCISAVPLRGTPLSFPRA